jgi:hypothetical protein
LELQPQGSISPSTLLEKTIGRRSTKEGGDASAKTSCARQICSKNEKKKLQKRVDKVGIGWLDKVKVVISQKMKKQH